MKKVLFLFLIILGSQQVVLAQKYGQELLDSLILLVPQQQDDTGKVSLLNRISNVYPYINPDEGLRVGKQALQLATKLKWEQGIADAYLAIGGNYANKADYANALDYEYKALKIYEKTNNKAKQAIMYRNIAIVYHTSKNQQKSLEYNQKALAIYQKLGDVRGVAAIYGNMANVYYSLDNVDKVLENDLEALALYRQLHDAAGEARLLGNIGNFYAEQGDFSEAMAFYFDALRKETALNNQNGVTRNMGNIGETYLDIYRSDEIIESDSLIPAAKSAVLKLALKYLGETVSKATELKQTEYVMAFGEVLSEAYMLSGNNAEALKVYKNYIQIRDSVYDVEKYNAATRLELNYEYGLREDSISYQRKLAEMGLLSEKKLRSRDQVFYIAGIALVLLVSGLMYSRWRILKKQKSEIEFQKRKTDDLLLNILPAETAEELKEHGSVKAKDFDQVSIMFTDFKNFTLLSESMSAQELVNEINYCYSVFDTIISKHNIEKIKTIGDSYMCAGGLPVPNKTNPVDVVQAAIEIRDFMLNEKKKREKIGKLCMEIRIGVHTGPVVAGIVGIKKFAYDIWGDAVNTAARLESSGEVGRVNISGATYELVKDKFNCIYRGKLPAKNKGEIDMYFAERLL